MKRHAIPLALWSLFFGAVALVGYEEMIDPGPEGTYASGLLLVVTAALLWLCQAVYILTHDP